MVFQVLKRSIPSKFLGVFKSLLDLFYFFFMMKELLFVLFNVDLKDVYFFFKLHSWINL